MTDDLAPTPAPDREPPPHAPGEAPPAGRRSSADIAAHRPAYKGEELDAARGPGLGCFWFQAAVLAFFLVLIPVGVNLNWSYEVLAALLFVVLGLLLFVGQTMIFLLRLVAADRRDAGRRRPRASITPTVGEIEDALVAATGTGDAARPDAAHLAERPADAAEPADRPADAAEHPADAAELAELSAAEAERPARPTADLPATADEVPADTAGAPPSPTAEPGSESVRE
jgi:hypothetical protein